MVLSNKSWSCLATLLCLLCIVICMLTVYLVDPFELYRESSILPVYSQEDYHNPGIAKHYDYDAVIVGTSMVVMSRPSVVDACFSVQSVKLPMQGTTISHTGYQLQKAFEHQDLKLAIVALDPYLMAGSVDEYGRIIEYLWNDDPLDDVNYLLNRDVLIEQVPRMLSNVGKPTENKRDLMYQYAETNYSRESVLSSVPRMAQEPMQDAEYRIERATDNIREHLEKYIAAHPQTQFYLYMPPYASACWYRYERMGLSERMYRIRTLVCEMLLKYDNVRIYDFSTEEAWIHDFDQYIDYMHHSSDISDQVMRAMAADECRILSAGQMEENNRTLRGVVKTFIEEIEPLL